SRTSAVSPDGSPASARSTTPTSGAWPPLVPWGPWRSTATSPTSRQATATRPIRTPPSSTTSARSSCRPRTASPRYRPTITTPPPRARAASGSRDQPIATVEHGAEEVDGPRGRPGGASPRTAHRGKDRRMAVADDLDRATDSQWDWVAEHTRTYLASGGTEGH